MAWVEDDSVELGGEDGDADGELKAGDTEGGERAVGTDGRTVWDEVKTKAVLGLTDVSEDVFVVVAVNLCLQPSRLILGGGGDFLDDCEEARSASPIPMPVSGTALNEAGDGDEGDTLCIRRNERKWALSTSGTTRRQIDPASTKTRMTELNTNTTSTK